VSEGVWLQHRTEDKHWQMAMLSPELFCHIWEFVQVDRNASTRPNPCCSMPPPPTPQTSILVQTSAAAARHEGTTVPHSHHANQGLTLSYSMTRSQQCCQSYNENIPILRKRCQSSLYFRVRVCSEWKHCYGHKHTGTEEILKFRLGRVIVWKHECLSITKKQPSGLSIEPRIHRQ
jgi:hypothetical protein